MDLYTLRGLFADDSQLVRIFDLNNDAEMIYEGEFSDLPMSLENYEVSSIDNIYPDNDGYVGINIELED